MEGRKKGWKVGIEGRQGGKKVEMEERKAERKREVSQAQQGTDCILHFSVTQLPNYIITNKQNYTIPQS